MFTMPGRRRSTPDTTPNAVVGAARRVHLDRRAEVERTRERSVQDWQRAAWRHYDEIGELHYAYNYFAAVASRVRLYAGFMDEDADSPAPIGNTSHLERSFVTAARYELDKLNGGIGGQPNLIRQMTLNLSVPGEVYLIGSHDSWSARSTSEFRIDGSNNLLLQTSRTAGLTHLQTLDPNSTFVARIWRTHPQFSDDADSSMRAVESDCSELLLLSRLIKASASSRLNAGLLLVADELRFRRMHDETVENQDGTESAQGDPLEEELLMTLTDPMGNTDSPSELMPALLRVPAELLDKAVKHITLGREFDENIVDRHDKTLNRVLNGLDIPKDIVTGLSGVRYSNARQITEDMYKAHVEPLIVLICEALTTVYLRPRMRARGYSEERLKRLHVWYDPSDVVVKPDRSEDADKGYERLLISGTAWRRAHGFSDTDAPSAKELIQRVALGGTVAPSTTLEFMRAVAPDFVQQAEQLASDSFGDMPAPDGAEPIPSGSEADANQTPGSTGGPSQPPEGDLPPDANDPNNVSVSSSNADSVLEALRQLTAAANSEAATGRQFKSNELADRERRLARALDVERRSRESLHSYLSDVVDNALKRAGARTVSKVRGDAELKARVENVRMSETFAAVPDDALERLGLDAERLVRDTIEDAHVGFVQRVASILRTGWSALGTHVVERLMPDHLVDIEKSWDWLLPQLVTRAANKLRDPKSDAQNVTMGIVRYATARAGGSHSEETVTPTSGRAVLADKALQATGWEFGNSYTWVYGVSESGFEAHERLDGLVFNSWYSDELAAANPEEWPFTTHWYPGDHSGCRCDVLPIPVEPNRNAPHVRSNFPKSIAPGTNVNS